ncbi:uncharacterized protein ACA1_100600 [Acanthamoeba castellanii str. Neff]|uniref:NadR/Ttd14 AAA domain-containing protein n=1 Tax=Acanthamoeba castellanii (strain ATCC 30010 / Neff) TaxID=1257118 RepID=L8GKH3_ACACF|nr:uncharacterized protein ACA1_100600 [Acanthamoeba castellanii str. Neff]ELR13223.1 hypothetical protein ACA1_100600 [Acanthamoeba castellanii str. Neff]
MKANARGGQALRSAARSKADKPLRPKFDVLTSHKSVFEYTLGCTLGLAGGYIIWGQELKKKADAIRELKEALKPEIVEVDPLQRLDQSHSDSQVYTVVLTGGPCGGKSTALATLTKHLRAQGYEVYSVPEIPTLVFTAGVPTISSMNEEQLLAFEKQILTTQIQLEESMKKIASAMDKPTVILLDRAALDISAYLPYSFWKKLLQDLDITEKQLRERYTAVVHLVTAANGAESYYTTANNAARTEGIEQARELDDKVKHAWIAHTRTFVADNTTDFPGKMQRVCSFLDDVLTSQHKAAPTKETPEVK